MDLKKVIQKNPLCLMSVNKTLNMYNTEYSVPIDALASLVNTDKKSRE